MQSKNIAKLLIDSVIVLQFVKNYLFLLKIKIILKKHFLYQKIKFIILVQFIKKFNPLIIMSDRNDH
jgi:hypothetical protein